MAVATPIMGEVNAFDASEAHVFTFSVPGTSVISGNTLVIENAQTLQVVYQQTSTDVNSHTVPSNTLENGVYYQVSVSVYDETGSKSYQSQPVQFYCFTTPTFIISGLQENQTIYASTSSFQANYDQAEGELLNSYRFVLYDTANQVLADSGVQYVGTTLPPPTAVTWMFSGLMNGETYKIKAYGTTAYGTEISTNAVTFNVVLTIPTTGLGISAKNECDIGAVIVQAQGIGLTTTPISELLIKRRKYGDFEWTVLHSFEMKASEIVKQQWADYMAQSGQVYEYAVSVRANKLESDVLLVKIDTYSNGVFITDGDSTYRLYEGVAYGSAERVQKVGIFEPFGKQYPVVVSNAKTNYDTGSFSGYILPDDFMSTGKVDRQAIVIKRNAILNFLNNKKAKILKDFNGNIWLCAITGNPTVGYADSYGMGVCTIASNFVQIGDANSADDLFAAGLIPEG